MARSDLRRLAEVIAISAPTSASCCTARSPRARRRRVLCALRLVGERFRKVAQRARAKLRGLVEEYQSGERCRRLEPDLIALWAGVGATRPRRARAHVANCSAVRTDGRRSGPGGAFHRSRAAARREARGRLGGCAARDPPANGAAVTPRAAHPPRRPRASRRAAARLRWNAPRGRAQRPCARRARSSRHARARGEGLAARRRPRTVRAGPARAAGSARRARTPRRARAACRAPAARPCGTSRPTSRNARRIRRLHVDVDLAASTSCWSRLRSAITSRETAAARCARTPDLDGGARSSSSPAPFPGASTGTALAIAVSIALRPLDRAPAVLDPAGNFCSSALPT